MPVSLSAEPAAITLGGGDEGRITLTLQNRGDAVSRFELRPSGPAARWATCEPAQVSVFPGESATGILVLRPPAGAPPGTFRIGVRAVDQTGSAGQADVVIAMTIQRPARLATPGAPEQAGPPAGGQTLPASVPTPPQPPPGSTLRPVSATSPVPTPPIAATPGQPDTTPPTARTTPPTGSPPSIPPGGGGGLQLTMDRNRFAAAPGGQERVGLSLQNDSGLSLDLELSVAGLPPGWYSLEPPRVALAPEAAANIALIILPPADSPSGSYPLAVSARAIQEGIIPARSNAVLEIAQPGELQIEIAPPSAHGQSGAEYQVQVSQRGAAPVRAALSVLSAVPGLQFVIEPSTLTVPPLGAAAARLTVRPTAILFGAEARAYPFTIVATPLGGSGSPVRVEARFSQRPAPTLKMQLVAPEQRAADEAVYMVRVTNPSDEVVEVEFSGRSPQNSLLFNFTPALIAIRPGATEETAVQVKPRAPLDQPGERIHGFTVRAEPGAVVAPAEASGSFIQTALQGPVLLLEPSSVSSSGAGTFALQLSNPRNAPLEVELRALSPDGRALVSVTPARLRLPPSGHGTTRVVVKPAERLLAGEKRRVCAFTITARTADMPRAGVAQGSLVQTPGVAFGPLLRWLALAVLGLAILFVAAFILFRVRTSPGPDPAAIAATADAIAVANSATAQALAGVATGTASAHAAATATASAEATALAAANATGTAIARSNDATRAAATRAAQDAMATQAAGQAAAKATQEALATASAKATADTQATAGAQTRAAQDTTPPSAGITRSPANPTRNDKIKLTVEASDNRVLASVQIVVNGVVVMECPGSPCSVEIGPFPNAASLTYTARVRDAAGNQAQTPDQKVNFGSAVVYDLVANADKASWESGGGKLTWPGGETDTRGFARWVTNAPLENNSTAPRVLETHPQWVDNGFIQGTFTDMLASGYIVEAADVFQAHVGFLRDAAAGSATFRVMIRVESGGNTWVGQAVDTYDGQIETITIPLSAYAGKRAQFLIRVDAGPSPRQDWAVWLDARVFRGPPP